MAEDGGEGALTTLQNLETINGMSWDKREELEDVVGNLANDPNLQGHVDSSLVNDTSMTATKIGVHKRNGISNAGFVASLTWRSKGK